MFFCHLRPPRMPWRPLCCSLSLHRQRRQHFGVYVLIRNWRITERVTRLQNPLIIHPNPIMLGFAENLGIIFFKTSSGVCQLDLATEQTEQLLDHTDISTLLPYTTFHTPAALLRM